MEDDLLRCVVVDDDVAVVIYSACCFQGDVNTRVFPLKILKLGLMKMAAGVVTEDCHLHVWRDRLQQGQSLQANVVVDDMYRFLCKRIDFGIRDVSLNGLAVVE